MIELILLTQRYKCSFSAVNVELEKIEQWFKSNQLSLLNIKKTKYTLLHKHSSKNDIPLKLPDLKIKNLNIERNSLIEFSGIMLDVSIGWRNHTGTVVYKIAKKHWSTASS